MTSTVSGLRPCNSIGFARGFKTSASSKDGAAGGVGSLFCVTILVAKPTVATRLVAPLLIFFMSTAPLLKITVEAPLRETNKSNLVPLTPIVAVGVLIS